jgi:hypothetical protein
MKIDGLPIDDWRLGIARPVDPAPIGNPHSPIRPIGNAQSSIRLIDNLQSAIDNG